MSYYQVKYSGWLSILINMVNLKIAYLHLFYEQVHNL